MRSAGTKRTVAACRRGWIDHEKRQRCTSRESRKAGRTRHRPPAEEAGVRGGSGGMRCSRAKEKKKAGRRAPPSQRRNAREACCTVVCGECSRGAWCALRDEYQKGITV